MAAYKAGGLNTLKDTLRVDGKCVVQHLVLKDRSTGVEWEIYIDNGRVVAEPWDVAERREYRLGSLLNDLDG